MSLLKEFASHKYGIVKQILVVLLFACIGNSYSMCIAKPTASGARLTTASGIVYYPDTPEGHAAQAADMAAAMGPGAGESHPEEPDKPTIVLMFRGLNPSQTSASVDATAAKINGLKGFTAKVFNHEDLAGAKAAIEPDKDIVLYGFSKGGESVQSMLASGGQKYKKAITIDPWWTVTQRWSGGAGGNADAIFNFYNPNWPDTKRNLTNPPAAGVSGKVTTYVLNDSPPSMSKHCNYPNQTADEVIKILLGGGAPDNTDCGTYTDSMWDTKCSDFFKYSQMKMQPTSGEVIPKEQIACNWQKLCKNILDKAKTGGAPSFSINSGFRTLAFNNSLPNASRTSDHLKGCAVDLSSSNNVALFKWFGASGLPFSQLIYEGNWVHVAYNGSSAPGNVVLATRTGSAPYLNGGGRSGSSLPPDLRWA